MNFHRRMMNDAAGPEAGGFITAFRALRLASSFFPSFFFLSPAVGGGWMTLIGSDAGKLSSRPCSSDSRGAGASAASSRSLLGRCRPDFVLGHGSIRNSPESSLPDASQAAGLASAEQTTPTVLHGVPPTRALDAHDDAGQNVRRRRRRPCARDLHRGPAALARRKVPREISSNMPRPAPMRRRRLRANRTDLERIKLRQRVLVDVSQRDLATTIIGETASLPLALAPIGLCGMQHGDGEILACRAAQAAGIPFMPFDHVDLRDRGRGAGGRQAVLVPALRHEGPRLHPRADRARRPPRNAARSCSRSTCRCSGSAIATFATA